MVEAINARTRRGSGFTILAVAEGAISKEDAALPKKDLKKKMEEDRKKYPSVFLCDCGCAGKGDRHGDPAMTVPGHTQRGGSPCPYDRILATRLGSAAAKLIMEEDYGYMVGIINGKTKKIPLLMCRKLRRVTPDAQEIKEAKRIGISFGD